VRVLLVVAASKYTGAAAVAEASCRSLRTAGVDARLLFVGGNNLQRRLQNEPWALPGLRKERRLRDVTSNLEVIRDAASPAELVVCHLPHDHLLCVLAGVRRRLPLVRAFRRREHLRPSTATRWLARRASAALLAHTGLEPALRRVVAALPAAALPVPVEDRFRPGADRALWRRRLEIPDDAPVVGMVGKLAAGRGFDLLLETAARVVPEVHILPVGHGEAAEGLEQLAERLGLADRLAWAGYQERELPELYATMDVVLFTAPGSDHGHRAISEAQGCGRPVVAAAIDGVGGLVEDGHSGLVAAAEPRLLAAAVSRVLGDPALAQRLGAAATTAVEPRRFLPCGVGMAAFFEDVIRGRHQERVESRP